MVLVGGRVAKAGSVAVVVFTAVFLLTGAGFAAVGQDSALLDPKPDAEATDAPAGQSLEIVENDVPERGGPTEGRGKALAPKAQQAIKEGELEALKNAKMALLPPGDITGVVTGTDGITPEPNVKIVLINAKTGEVVASSRTLENGRYVLKDVPEGLYIIRVGNPGMAGMLMVTETAATGFLNVVLPTATRSPPPGWLPKWLGSRPVVATALATGTVVTAVTATVVVRNRRDGEGKKRVISPITP